MRKTGKVIDFTPYEAVKDKEGNDVISKADGLMMMKRTVVVDCRAGRLSGKETAIYAKFINYFAEFGRKKT